MSAGKPVFLSPNSNCRESGTMCSFAPSQSAIFGLCPYKAPLHSISNKLLAVASDFGTETFRGISEFVKLSGKCNPNFCTLAACDGVVVTVKPTKSK